MICALCRDTDITFMHNMGKLAVRVCVCVSAVCEAIFELYFIATRCTTDLNLAFQNVVLVAVL